MTPNAPATKGVIGCHIGCSGVAESLVEQGFLCTEDSDCGLCYYRITDSGIERSKALDEECNRMREACFSKLSDEELAKHTELLDKLIR